MSLIQRLKWAVAPDPRRSALLLWSGLAGFLAAGAVAMAAEAPAALAAFLYFALAWSWLIAACGAIGYVRWFFRQAREEARKIHRARLED